MGETQTNQEKALGRIKTAFWAAIILVIINGGLRVLAIMGSDQTLEGIVTYIADPIIMLALAIWLYKGRSRAASILLLIVFLLGKASLFIPLLEVELSPEQQNALAKAATRQLIWIGIFGYTFIQGVLGTFAYHRLMKVNADS